MLEAGAGLLASGSGGGSKARGESGPTHQLQIQACHRTPCVPQLQTCSPQVFQRLLLEEDFLGFVKTKLLSFFFQPEAASPLIPWTPGPAFPEQQQQDGPPAFVLLNKTRKAESTASSISFLIFIGTFWLYNTAISILTSEQADTWTDQHFQKNKLIVAFGGGTLYFQRQ